MNALADADPRMADSTRCVIVVDGGQCASDAPPDAPLPLCELHLLVAHDWVERGIGTTDLLPSPCVACGSQLGVHFASGWVCADCDWRFGDVPDGELPPPLVEVVYYLGLGDLVKIGTSTNPRRRIAALPHDTVLAFERGGRRRERSRHEQFAATRVNGGEWFRTDAALRAHILDLRAGHDDPWLQYGRWVSRARALQL